MRPLTRVLFPAALILLACSGDMVQSCTSKMVGKTVEATKGVTTGVAEGIEEGRKAGGSVDGAHLVSSMAELASTGGITVAAVEPIDDTSSRVVLAVENTSEQPLRVIGLTVSVLDTQGFVQKPTDSIPSEVTVPPRAKERVAFTVAIPAAQVGTVRAWDQDLKK